MLQCDTVIQYDGNYWQLKYDIARYGFHCKEHCEAYETDFCIDLPNIKGFCSDLVDGEPIYWIKINAPHISIF